MAAPEVAIGRFATRLSVPGPEEAFEARRLVEQALRRIGPQLDSVLEAAGLDAQTVLAVPRLSLRLTLRGEVDAAELGAAWGTALAQAILAALPAAQARAGQQEPDATPALPELFRDVWTAETALLRLLRRGGALPWWAAALGRDGAPPARPGEILARWVARDPLRAAWSLAALLGEEASIADELTPAEAAAMARALLAALPGGAAALPATPRIAADAAVPGAASEMPGFLAPLLARLPAAQRLALARIAANRRAPWLAAAVIATAPAFAPLLPTLLPHIAALPPETFGGTPGSAPPVPDAAQHAAARQPDVTTAPLAQTTASEVWCGGLLLLIRPLARLRPGWLQLGDGLSERLLALGLIALRRLAEPLPPAARRAALERDRPLLAVFAGSTPPDMPLEEVVLPAAIAAEAEDALAAILAALPEGVAHAPAALRRAYGRDPFAGDAANDALCRLLLRPGRLILEDVGAVLAWPLDVADIALRRAGWDVDPGWVPWLGRRVAFRYGGP
jgi:hypothetical protein